MTALDALIREQIATEEGLTVEAYIDLALYHPTDGFYCHGGAAGRRGDFITSPEVGPLFGAVIARMIDAVWIELGRPKPFTVIEAAAGIGTLARTILAAQPACWAAVNYLAVERSPLLRAQQPDWVQSVDDLPAESVGPGVVLANELLDNLAFGLLLDGVEVRVGDLLPTMGVVPRQDQARAWVERALATVDRGRVVVLDYCSTTDDLRSRPWVEWLRTYREHDRGGYPFEGPGTKDITTEVCIDQLPAGARRHQQAAYLRSWGIEELVEEGRQLWTEQAHVGDLAALKARSRVRESEALLDEQGLGGFTVLEWVVGETPASD